MFDNGLLKMEVMSGGYVLVNVNLHDIIPTPNRDNNRTSRCDFPLSSSSCKLSFMSNLVHGNGNGNHAQKSFY